MLLCKLTCACCIVHANGGGVVFTAAGVLTGIDDLGDVNITQLCEMSPFWYVAAIVYMYCHNWSAIMSAQNNRWAATFTLCAENSRWPTIIMHTEP